MCPQHDKITAPKIDADLLINQSDVLCLADQISMQGGEPFIIPEALKLIDVFSKDSAFESVRMVFVTNGTVLQRHLETLSRFKRVSLSVSLDSVGKTYEHIRKGAKWNITESNLLATRDIIHNSRPEWELFTTMVLMKSSLESLVDFVDWCVSHRIMCNSFMPIYQNGFLEEEDIFKNIAMLESIPNWRDIFSAALTKLISANWIYSAKQLAAVADQLDNLTCNGTNKIKINFLDRVNRFEAEMNTESPPQLLFEYRGFNIIDYRNSVLAFSTSIGHFDIPSLTPEIWEYFMSKGLVHSAKSVEGIKAEIDQAL
jgi:sulfatase maturation enzyme AslB (radical SAM superfamily)